MEQSDDGGIMLYDCVSGDLLREIASPLPGPSVTKLLFADADRVLLAFSGEGALAVFDVESGALLHRSSFSQYGLSFRDEARYDVFVAEEKDQLVIVYDDDLYTEAVLFTLDRESWTCVGGHMGVSCYIPATDELILRPYLGEVYRMPLLGTMELRQMAEDLLSREPVRVP